MTNSMSVFTFNSNNVRTFADDHNEMWFCAKDVCAVLGYANDSDTIKKHCKERGVAKRYLGVVTGKKANGEDSVQQIEMSFINEPNRKRPTVPYLI
jgi:prophage antirepressor-like protein